MAQPAGGWIAWLAAVFVLGTALAETGPERPGLLASPLTGGLALQTHRQTIGPERVQQGLRFEGGDSLFGTGTQVSLIYGRVRELVTGSPWDPRQLERETDTDAWSLLLGSAPQQASGLRYRIHYTDVDEGFQGGQEYGFGAEMAGQRQRDYRVGWQRGSLGFDFGRDQLVDKETGYGLARSLWSAAAFGFRYEAQELRIDTDARFSGGLTKRLLSDKGYDLGNRKLGAAQSGLTDLEALRGLADDYRAGGWRQGDLAVAFHDRTLDWGGAKLVDRGQSATVGGLRVARTTRQLDGGFKPLAAAGYGHWRDVQNGREDATEASLTWGLLDAGWSTARLRQEPTGAGVARVQRTELRRLLLRPATNLSLSYRETDVLAGAEDLWATGDRAQLSHKRDTRYELGYTLVPHRLTLSYGEFLQAKPQDRLTGHEYGVKYDLGRRTKLQYRERAQRRLTETAAETTAKVSRLQTMAVETALGLSALHERETADGAEPVTHQRLRFERSFGPRYQVAGGWETWGHAAEPKFDIAGYRGVLKVASPDAEAYDVRVTLRPGQTELTAWRRELDWQQSKANNVFAEGGHRLTETGVIVQQAVAGDFRLRAEWSRFERDEATDQERRAVVVAFQPEDKGFFIPTAEVGYREVLDSEGETRPTLYASAGLRPTRSLEVVAKVAQNEETAGARAVARDWAAAERRAYEVSATQRLGTDGQAKVTYARAPVAPRRPLDGEDLEDARKLTVAFRLPTNWLVSGLSLRGQFQHAYEPGYGADLDQTVNDHQATLAWSDGAAAELLASYRLRSELIGYRRDGSSRFEFQFSHKLAGQEFALTGYLNEKFDRWADWGDEERYRVGFNFNRPF